MDKMREDFERWADGEGLFIDGGGTKGYPSMATQGAWQAWQHLYPMVPFAYREGYHDGAAERNQHPCQMPDKAHADRDWNNSTAKARLEGKDD